MQRVGEGHLEPKMPPVSRRIACSRRKEWLRGWGWMAGMGGQEGGAPHQRLSAQLRCSVAVAGCIPASPAARRVRVWGGCRFMDRSHRLRSGRLAGGNVDTADLTGGRFDPPPTLWGLTSCVRLEVFVSGNLISHARTLSHRTRRVKFRGQTTRLMLSLKRPPVTQLVLGLVRW